MPVLTVSAASDSTATDSEQLVTAEVQLTSVRPESSHFEILPLDSDDLLASLFLEKTVPVLEANAGLSFVYTATLFFGEKNEMNVILNELGMTGCLTLGASLLVSQTLIPFAASRFIKRRS